LSACPCNALKLGAAQLAVPAAVLAQSQTIFGGPAGPVIAAALHGAVPLPMALLLIGCAGLLVCGAGHALVGYRAARTHYDVFDPVALAWSGGGCLFFFYGVNQGWGLDALAWGECIAALSRAALLAGLAFNAAGLWLQLRSPLALLAAEISQLVRPPKYPPLPLPDVPPWDVPQYPPPVDAAKYEEVIATIARQADEDARTRDAACQQAVAERDALIESLTGERDRFADDLMHTQAAAARYQASGKKLLAEVKPLRIHCEAIRQFGWREMSKASHPDTAPPEQRAARDELFKLVTTIFGRN
jgi:hypothetical protein